MRIEGGSIAVIALTLAGCASGRLLSAREVQAPTATALAGGRLTHSLFPKPAERENVSEEVIQQVVNAPLEPDFPARAGVVLLSAPFTRRAYAALEPGDDAPQVLARELERAGRHFVMVSDISPYLADGQHVESLRELAARYRLKYLVVLSARFADRSFVNALGWTWLSVIGIPFVPAYTLRSAALLEATLMDVRTGTFLFTTQIHAQGVERTTPFSTREKLAELQREMGRRAARILAAGFVAKCNRLVNEAARKKGRGAPAGAPPRAIAPSPAPAPGASVPGGA